MYAFCVYYTSEMFRCQRMCQFPFHIYSMTKATAYGTPFRFVNQFFHRIAAQLLCNVLYTQKQGTLFVIAIINGKNEIKYCINAI